MHCLALLAIAAARTFYNLVYRCVVANDGTLAGPEPVTATLSLLALAALATRARNYSGKNLRRKQQPAAALRWLVVLVKKRKLLKLYA